MFTALVGTPQHAMASATPLTVRPENSHAAAATPSRVDSPFAVIDDVFNLSSRFSSRLFGLEQRADPVILGQTLTRIGELLQQGVVGYEVRRLRNGQRHVSFLSVQMAPGGPRGRPYPAGDPRARLSP
ncbi:hypothetical protein HS125_09370 [bacterium]|nr:hypothetical protein [bacterium]